MSISFNMDSINLYFHILSDLLFHSVEWQEQDENIDLESAQNVLKETSFILFPNANQIIFVMSEYYKFSVKSLLSVWNSVSSSVVRIIIKGDGYNNWSYYKQWSLSGTECYIKSVKGKTKFVIEKSGKDTIISKI